MFKYILFTIILLINFSAKTQVEIPSADQRVISRMVEALSLDPVQHFKIDSIYRLNQLELNRVEHEIDSLERSTITEKELNLRVAVLNEEKRDIRDFRELDVLNVMNQAQQRMYAEKIKPEKPTVLHFGIHDRSKCQVCIR